MTGYAEIPLEKICTNPRNPRKSLSQRKLEELAASIKQKGVIEPIIVRPSELRKGAKGKVKEALVEYEIVAGERRWRASIKAGLATIPAVVRELSDTDAYDFMIIENLHREDLTEREQAESFKAWVDRSGEMGVKILAEKIGISPAYIRARIRVLELPAKVLKAWDEGKLVFGHLQQLLRVAGDPKALKEMSDRLTGSDRWGDGISTVGQVRRWINDLAPALSGAFFPMKEACAGCGSSSIVQKDLFDVDADKAQCLNPACFKKRQNDYLAGHWKETSLARTHGTNGFRFEDRRGGYNYHNFRYGPRPAEKCKACPNFVTIINVDGTVDEPQVCFGKDECFNGATRPKSAKAEPRDPEAPRAGWHGEYFRDVFLSKRIPEQLAKLDVDDPMIKILLLACAIHGNKSIVSAREDYSGAILTKTPTDQLRICKTIIEKIVLSGQHVGPSSWNGFGTKGRRIVAEYLAIDLAKEFSVDKDYLDKKTRAECLAFIKKFNIQSDPKFKAYVEKKHKRQADKLDGLKKSEVVEAILESGVPLVGKVPTEIIGRKS